MPNRTDVLARPGRRDQVEWLKRTFAAQPIRNSLWNGVFGVLVDPPVLDVNNLNVRNRSFPVVVQTRAAVPTTNGQFARLKHPAHGHQITLVFACKLIERVQVWLSPPKRRDQHAPGDCVGLIEAEQEFGICTGESTT